MAKSVQCIKQIPYQKILDFRAELERLQSWKPYLLTIQRYFSNQSVPVNKKVIVKEYYACSKVYFSFCEEYEQRLVKLEEVMNAMVSSPKI